MWRFSESSECKSTSQTEGTYRRLFSQESNDLKSAKIRLELVLENTRLA